MPFGIVHVIMTILATKVTEGGRIVIPADVRKRMGIEIGETITLEFDEDESLRISTRRQALRRAQKLFKKYVPEGVSLVDELLADRRRENENE